MEFDLFSPRRDAMREFYSEIELTAEQEAEAAVIEDILNASSRATVHYMARLLASKCNRELLGETEFQIRDAVHRLGAEGIDAALAERKKRGTKGRVSSVHAVAKTPNSSDTPERA
jgi:hypothetical protein